MKIRIWFMAHFQDYRFFRVIYKDGKITYPLHYAEANGLTEVFDGKLFIDYEYAKELIKSWA